MKNIKHKQLIINYYIEEFYKFNIREEYVEDNPKRVAKYINGLIFEMQDKMNLQSPNSVEEAYQFSLKEEEKLAWGNQIKSQGSFIGWGSTSERGKPIEVSRSSQLEHMRKGRKDRGQRPYTRGRGGSKGF